MRQKRPYRRPTKRRPYPWGSQQPRRRLHICAMRLRYHLRNIANTRDYRRLFPMLAHVLSNTSDLVETMQYISRNGMRSHTCNHTPLTHQEVDNRIDTVLRNAAAFASTNSPDLSRDWIALRDSLEQLLRCSGNASRNGVKPSFRHHGQQIWEPYYA